MDWNKKHIHEVRRLRGAGLSFNSDSVLTLSEFEIIMYHPFGFASGQAMLREVFNFVEVIEGL